MGGERFLFSSRVQPKQLWWSQRSGINTKLISGKSLMVTDSFQSLAHPSACTQRKGTSGARKEGNTCAVGPSGVVPSHLTREAPSIPPAMQTREMWGDQRHHLKLLALLSLECWTFLKKLLWNNCYCKISMQLVIRISTKPFWRETTRLWSTVSFFEFSFLF